MEIVITKISVVSKIIVCSVHAMEVELRTGRAGEQALQAATEKTAFGVAATLATVFAEGCSSTWR